MTEQTLLDNSNTEPVLDPSKNYYDQLVGEGRKFLDNESLAKGKYESDIHIRNLELRMDQMREDYLKERDSNAQRAKLEDLIEKLETRATTTTTESTTPANVDSKPRIDPDQLPTLISKEIQSYEVNKGRANNFNAVKAKLIERFGTNYQTSVKDRLDSLGLTAEFADNLAKTSPNAFFNTLGLNEVPQTDNTAPPRSSTTFRPTGPTKRKYSYYQELRKKDPKAYYDPKIAIEMDRMSQELGDEFFDVPG
jgi:hypothetical protein